MKILYNNELYLFILMFLYIDCNVFVGSMFFELTIVYYISSKLYVSIFKFKKRTYFPDLLLL